MNTRCHSILRQTKRAWKTAIFVADLGPGKLTIGQFKVFESLEQMADSNESCSYGNVRMSAKRGGVQNGSRLQWNHREMRLFGQYL